MKCKCGYITKNKKSFSNHWRTCLKNNNAIREYNKEHKGITYTGRTCIVCGNQLIKQWKKGTNPKYFCDSKCYGNYRAKYFKGEKAPNYIHGKCNSHLLFRASREYKFWRKSVFERDNYACVICHKKSSGDLEADHIKDFALYPELRLNINNGRTLCKSCHKKTDNYGNKKSNSKQRT